MGDFLKSVGFAAGVLAMPVLFVVFPPLKVAAAILIFLAVLPLLVLGVGLVAACLAGPALGIGLGLRQAVDDCRRVWRCRARLGGGKGAVLISGRLLVSRLGTGFGLGVLAAVAMSLYVLFFLWLGSGGEFFDWV